MFDFLRRHHKNVIFKEVDNRALVLAVDYLYRENMKIFEVEKLLPASKTLIEALSVSVSEVPVEGYYTESEELREYFLNIRSLQKLPPHKNQRVFSLDEYHLLSQVMSSEIFGSKTKESAGFLPQRLDSLYFALEETDPSDWTVEILTEKAHNFTIKNQDNSLVGIAAYIKDSVVLAALRESVVLYAGIVLGCPPIPPKIKYVWNVDRELQNKVNQFIRTFNELTSSNILEANADNVQYFYDAFKNNQIIGRCVRIGFDDRREPIENYHWAINYRDSKLVVDEFWSPQLWTTERYRHERLRRL